MVVISVAIITKSGKALLARQFVETPRIRVEALVAAFPKLVASTTSTSKQHTFVETDSVRYVYLPIEALYVVLITNKGSNIIEDLDTLRLIAKVIPDQCAGQPVSEETVTTRAFEIVFALDEIVTFGGYREDVTLHQIRANLEMESHEEKLAQMIKAAKMAEAKEAAAKRARELNALAKEKAAAAAHGAVTASSRDSRYAGISSNGSGMTSPGGSSADYRSGSSGYSASSSGGFGSSTTSSVSSSAASASASASGAGADSGAAASRRPPGAAGGMKLGAKKGGLGGGGGALAGLMAEEGLRATDLGDAGGSTVSGGAGGIGGDAAGGGSAASIASAAAAAAAAAASDHVTFALEEKVAVALTRDGSIASMDVRGSLTVSVLDERFGRLQIQLDRGDIAPWTFQTHPNLNKQAFTSDGTIVLKQTDRSFPVGVPLGVLKWRFQLKDSANGSAAPLAITCWPEANRSGGVTVTVEYNLQNDAIALDDVVIRVPLGPDDVPNIAATPTEGEVRHNTVGNALEWRIPVISADNASSSIEFSTRHRDDNVFFPVTVGFSSHDLLCPINVGNVTVLDPEHAARDIRKSISKIMAVESYSVE